MKVYRSLNEKEKSIDKIGEHSLNQILIDSGDIKPHLRSFYKHIRQGNFEKTEWLSFTKITTLPI